MTINYIQLDGSIRDEFGSASTRRLLKSGNIPGVIYGEGGENIYVSVPMKDFHKEYLKGAIQTKPIELNIDKKKHKVLVHQMDLDPVKDMPIHIDFVSLENKKEVKVLVPLKAINQDKSPGIKKGGYLNYISRKLPLMCDINKIPNEIIVDITGMHLGYSKKIDEITLPDGVKPIKKGNFPIISIVGRGKSDTEEATATADATTAAPAAAAAAPAADAAKKK